MIQRVSNLYVMFNKHENKDNGSQTAGHNV
jgi:hypothetical protein